MPAVIRALDEAARRARHTRGQIADDLREARLRAGLSQTAVGRALGCSAATISRVERGLVPKVTLEFLARHGAAVGLVLRVNVFPGGSPIRDAGQLRLLKRLEPNIGPGLRWSLERPVGRDDLRAFDAAAVRPGLRIGFDAWSRVRDLQAQARASIQKMVDSGVERLILVLADTEANRRAVRDAGEALRRAFPVGSRKVLQALRGGNDPGGNGIVFL
jgi:transcriptional regulator with XRE-family HTH domain